MSADVAPLAHKGLRRCCVITWLHSHELKHTEGEIVTCDRCNWHGIIYTQGIWKAYSPKPTPTPTHATT